MFVVLRIHQLCIFKIVFCIYSLPHIHGLWLKYWWDRMLIPGVPISYFSTGVHSKFENVTLWSSMKQMPWHPVIASSQLILMSGPPMIWMIILEKRLNKGYVNKRDHTFYYNHLSIISNFLPWVKLKSWVVLKNYNSWMMKFTVLKNGSSFRITFLVLYQCVLDENSLDFMHIFRWFLIRTYTYVLWVEQYVNRKHTPNLCNKNHSIKALCAHFANVVRITNIKIRIMSVLFKLNIYIKLPLRMRYPEYFARIYYACGIWAHQLFIILICAGRITTAITAMPSATFILACMHISLHDVFISFP